MVEVSSGAWGVDGEEGAGLVGFVVYEEGVGGDFGAIGLVCFDHVDGMFVIFGMWWFVLRGRGFEVRD